MLFPLSLKVAVWMLFDMGVSLFFHLTNILIYIFLPKNGANFRRRCIIEALGYINSDTILYSYLFFITLLDLIFVSSDDEIDDYKSDGNISDENDSR